MAGVLAIERRADEAARPGYRIALALYCTSSVLEATAEPAYVAVQVHMLWASRALVEGSAHLARCVLTYTLLRTRGPALALEAFAWAQVAYAITLAGGFWLGALLRGDPLVPWRGHGCPDRRLAGGEGAHGPGRLLGAYALQQLAKYALTHGESLVLLAWVADAEQGTYALVLNLGSLLARFLLEPAEETAFAHLAQHARAAAEARGRADAHSVNAGNADAAEDDIEHAARAERAEALAAAGEVLARVARRLLLAGLVFAAFGPAFSRLLLQLVYGLRWSGGRAPVLLASYCVHVPVMALNGVLEAAVRALATPAQLGAFNRYLGACAVAYWLGMLLLLRAGLGLHGMVLANAVNLGARAAHHLRLLGRLFGPTTDGAGCERQWARKLLPTVAQAAMLLAAAVAVSALALRQRKEPVIGLRDAALHLAVGAANFIAVACALVRVETGVSVAQLLRGFVRARAKSL